MQAWRYPLDIADYEDAVARLAVDRMPAGRGPPGELEDISGSRDDLTGGADQPKWFASHREALRMPPSAADPKQGTVPQFAERLTTDRTWWVRLLDYAVPP